MMTTFPDTCDSDHTVDISEKIGNNLSVLTEENIKKLWYIPLQLLKYSHTNKYQVFITQDKLQKKLYMYTHTHTHTIHVSLYINI